MLWDFNNSNNNKTLQKQLKKFVVFLAKVSLLNSKSETFLTPSEMIAPKVSYSKCHTQENLLVCLKGFK